MKLAPSPPEFASDKKKKSVGRIREDASAEMIGPLDFPNFSSARLVNLRPRARREPPYFRQLYPKRRRNVVIVPSRAEGR